MSSKRQSKPTHEITMTQEQLAEAVAEWHIARGRSGKFEIDWWASPPSEGKPGDIGAIVRIMS